MLMAGPSLAQLRAFVALARTRRFGDAADDLGVTQPAVSAALHALEGQLGGQLVERSPRGVLLTPLGASLLPSAERVLASLDELLAEGRRAGRPHSGPLRLGVIPTIAPYLLPTLLGDLRQSFPELAPEVTEGQTRLLLEGLAAGELDLLVLALPTGRPEVRELPLYWEEFLLLVPADHELAGRSELPLATLAGLEVLLLEEGHCLRDQAVDVCRLAGASGRTARAASLTTLSQLVAARLGVTLLPASAVPVEVGEGLATARFGGSPRPGRRVGLVQRASTPRAGEHEELARSLRAAAASRLPVSVEG